VIAQGDIMGMSKWYLGRSADEWFADVLRWYTEEHQGCPSCQERHCVFRAEWGTRVEFYCTACDFSAARDSASNRCTVVAGDSPPALDFLSDSDWPFEIRPALS
jgi:hypothetical protein